MEYLFSERMKAMKGSAIREIFKMSGQPGVISFAGGNPAPETFPNEQLAEIAKEVLQNDPVTALQYGITEGYLPLRNAVKERLKEKEAIGQEFDDTIIVSGAQQALEHTVKVFINPGDGVIVEQPSFIGTLNALRSYQADLYSVPLLDDGMDLDVLEQLVTKHSNIKLIYTIPTFQNPTGITMSVEKRKRLYDIAKKHNIIFLEDNPYGELAYDGVKTPTIKSMDTEGIVVYVGSFSKILSPGLRLGFVCAHQKIIERITVNKQISDVHTSMLPQILAAEYLKRYNIDDAIVETRNLYKHRCEYMLQQIDTYFPETCSHTTPKGGLFIWCDMNGDYDTMEVAKDVAKDKVVFVPGSTFMVDGNAKSSAFRLNFSTMSDENIKKGIEIMGNSLKKIMSR